MKRHKIKMFIISKAIDIIYRFMMKTSSYNDKLLMLRTINILLDYQIREITKQTLLVNINSYNYSNNQT